MAVLDYILEGLEAALELERELGVRTVEIDRALLANEPRDAAVNRPTTQSPNHPIAQSPNRPTTQSPNHPITQSPNQTNSSLVFLHDRPLSPKGVEMVAKIIGALGLTAETAPVVVAPPIPNAKIYVFLGFPALRKYMPTLRIEENSWGKSPKGKDILVVKSPEEILRFATVTPAVEKIKKDMWRSLKAVKQRLAV